VTDSRDDIKQEFLRFVNGGIRNYVYTFFHQHLPTLAEWALQGKGAKKGMAWYGQSVEAEIRHAYAPHAAYLRSREGATGTHWKR
jgi:hypothetical protein